MHNPCPMHRKNKFRFLEVTKTDARNAAIVENHRVEKYGDRKA